MSVFLAGDVGGTKTNLALFDSEADRCELLCEATFPSSQYPSLEAIVQVFLGQAAVPVQRASFGVAGPVFGNKVSVTNLPWMVDAQHIQEALHFERVSLLNDLASIAYAVPHLVASDLHVLHDGSPVPGGTLAVIAPGTGLGEAFLTWDGEHPVPHASEGGHTDFGPTDRVQLALLTYLQERFDRVSYERICSGIGMPNIYDFLKDAGRAEEPAWLADQLATAADRTPVIAQAALDTAHPCSICEQTLDIFVSVLGAEAGNLALKVLSTGGVYLGGGIPPRILPVLEKETFRCAFLNKGRLSGVIASMPVCVILNPKAALLGAAYYGLNS